MSIFISDGLTLTLIRLVLGIVMVYYGIPKIKDLKANADNFVKMGFNPGFFWGTIVALLEFFGGIAIILGFYSGLIAIFFAIQMAVGVIWKITKTDKPFTDWSYDVILLMLCFVIIAFGPGLYAITPFI